MLEVKTSQSNLLQSTIARVQKFRFGTINILVIIFTKTTVLVATEVFRSYFPLQLTPMVLIEVLVLQQCLILILRLSLESYIGTYKIGILIELKPNFSLVFLIIMKINFKP